MRKRKPHIVTAHMDSTWNWWLKVPKKKLPFPVTVLPWRAKWTKGGTRLRVPKKLRGHMVFWMTPTHSTCYTPDGKKQKGKGNCAGGGP